MFYHGGCSWNRSTVVDIISSNSDISMLQECICLATFPDGLEVDTTVDISISEQPKKTISEPSGYFFWNKQNSPSPPKPVEHTPPPISDAAVITSLLTCTSRVHFEPRNGDAEAVDLTKFQIPPIFPNEISSNTDLDKRSRFLNSASPVQSKHRASHFAEAENIFWCLLTARNSEEFVTCGGRRSDGCTPTKQQALDVLKYYRRVISSSGWKLDRKKMSKLRDNAIVQSEKEKSKNLKSGEES